MPAQQIPLALPVDPSMGEDDFLITQSNQTAVVQLNNHDTLLLLGPKGTGKSHLARIWQKRHKATLFDGMNVATLNSAVLWEDADRSAWNAQTQQNAFHLLNSAKEKQFPLLITATTPPAQWPLTLADLRSRLLAVSVAQMEMPDDMLVAGLLLKHFKDRQLRVSEEVLNYILPRIARDGAVIERFVKQLDEASLAQTRAITVPLVKTALDLL
ncbi:MAG: DNA replication protein [Alphaproteobacteria bacterium]|nr:DNA replication protein [Alphaproteobacteria bacterium]